MPTIGVNAYKMLMVPLIIYNVQDSPNSSSINILSPFQVPFNRQTVLDLLGEKCNIMPQNYAKFTETILGVFTFLQEKN